MPKFELEGLLEESVESVLETMFFSATLGPAAPEAETAAAILAARLLFHGSPSGTLGICISDASARLLAARFLGEDESELTEAQTGQVVCELANMLCGSVVSRLESEMSFDLASPELVAPSIAIDDTPAAHVRSFELDNGVLTLSLRFQEAA